MSATAQDDSTVAATAHSISCVLRSGRVTTAQSSLLQAACRSLSYCRWVTFFPLLSCLQFHGAIAKTCCVGSSIGIHVRSFGTVICTDSILKEGFVDLSLCPVHLSLAGSVISRAITFHDQVPVRYVLRSDLPDGRSWQSLVAEPDHIWVSHALMLIWFVALQKWFAS